ncbi:MAG TPA: ribbon-helix-helix domain-containing protein [Caldilinea sp.]|nr:ribbon-helix-helix domain-containing protein [Caldilinea sp.]
MTVKTIQMTIDEELLVSVDALVQELGTSRSALIREALEEALRRHRIRVMEERQIRGYELHPVQPGEFDDFQAEQVWGAE